MKKMMLSALVLGLLALTVATAFATEKIQFHGIGVTGTADSDSSDGCIKTFILFSAEVSNDNDTSGKRTFAEVYYWHQYRCTQGDPTFLLYAHNRLQISNRDFNVDGNLASATLNTTVPVYDEINNQTLNLVISMTWTANGEPERFHSNGHETYGNITVHTNYSAIFQPATVSGSILLDGTDLVAGQTLFTSPITKSASATITVTH